LLARILKSITKELYCSFLDYSPNQAAPPNLVVSARGCGFVGRRDGDFRAGDDSSHTLMVDGFIFVRVVLLIESIALLGRHGVRRCKTGRRGGRTRRGLCLGTVLVRVGLKGFGSLCLLQDILCGFKKANKVQIRGMRGPKTATKLTKEQPRRWCFRREARPSTLSTLSTLKKSEASITSPTERRGGTYVQYVGQYLYTPPQYMNEVFESRVRQSKARPFVAKTQNS